MGAKKRVKRAKKAAGKKGAFAKKSLDVQVKELQDSVRELKSMAEGVRPLCYECSCGPCLECWQCRICTKCRICKVCKPCEICKICKVCDQCYECGVCQVCLE